MRAPLLLAALLLVHATAAARAPEPSYREQARDLLAALDASVLRARVATVEHAFGDRDARQTAHVMRVEGPRVEAVAAQLAGLAPPRAHARTHATLLQAAAWYAEAMGLLEACFRRADEEACHAGGVRVGWGATYRDVAASALGARGFS
ncbi:MAG TPA: hypothetical protein VNX21_07390 [Candidatus Thermoplasmatota archaeon]|nr:hypothetical protein [Candidatus Thermoplasmatota archaeon]